MKSATAENLQDLPRGFHALTVADVRRETDDATSVAFSIPVGKEDIFSFRAGQYLTLLREFDGEALRRPYSVCVSPDEGELRVCVKKLPGGRMSSFVNDELAKTTTWALRVAVASRRCFPLFARCCALSPSLR